jgi:hypothetical protein
MARTPAPIPVPSGDGLLSPGEVRLFGRPFTGLAIGDLAVGASANNQLAAAIRAARQEHRPLGLARIYGFSYLGNYFKLPEPAVFLVFDDGQELPPDAPGQSAPIGLSGVEFSSGVFAEGVRMWVVDQLDMIVRLDIHIGWVKDLLLEEMTADSNLTGGDTVRRADLVGRDANLIGRDANLIGRGR